MWYAASEIIVFLVVAAALGGFVGFAAAQSYTISLSASKERAKANAKAAGELEAAREQITELKRIIAQQEDSAPRGARLAQRVEEASGDEGDVVQSAEAV